MLIPIYGFLEGDTIGLLVLAHDHDRIADVVKKLQAAAKVRVPYSNNVKALYQNRVLDFEATVAEVGLTALDRFDVIRTETRYDDKSPAV